MIVDVHARDIVDGFVRDSVLDASEFAWESQLRFYWDRGLVGGTIRQSTKSGSQSCASQRQMCCLLSVSFSRRRALAGLRVSAFGHAVAKHLGRICLYHDESVGAGNAALLTTTPRVGTSP